MDLFESARLKLERATEHLNEVYRRMGEADLSAWERHIDPVEKVQNVIFRMKNPIDSRWALGIGDAVHNMRSALDYVIDDAARALQGRSTRYHFFPIAVDDGARQQAHNPVGRFRDWHPPLEGTSRAVQDFVRDILPYHGRSREDAEQTALNIVQKMDNTDKHRALHSGVLYTSDVPTDLPLTSTETPRSTSTFCRRPPPGNCWKTAQKSFDSNSGHLTCSRSRKWT